MEEKLRFVLDYERDEWSMVELCQRYGVSRETGYVWLRRYREHGVPGLVELNRAADRHRNRTAPDIEEAILELRQGHMRWGPRKLKRILERDEPQRDWPAASTIGEMLKRAGLVVARKKRRTTAPYTEPLGHAVDSNRVWCADFKGWFRTTDGARIDPLTISDAYSRYLLRCQLVEKTNTVRVQAIFEAAFSEYGLPQAIRTDNGAPFASHAPGGLSRLSVWWIKLGIVPERIEAGHPEQNGRHERLHRTLKQEVATPPASDRRAQQRLFDEFRREYNEVRPHEALGMQTPAALYVPSARAYPGVLRQPEYPDSMLVRSVDSQGCFGWKRRQRVYISQVLAGEQIGLSPSDEHCYTIYFAHVPLARFDSHHSYVLPLPKDFFDKAEAGKGEESPSPAPHPLVEAERKLSGMCPV